MHSELKRQHDLAKELVSEHLDRGMDRRDMLKKAGLLGIGIPAMSAALGARGAFAQASPSPATSPAAAEKLEVGKHDGKTLKVAVALAESEVTVFQNVAVAKFKELTGGDVELVKIEAKDVVNTLQAQVKSGNVQVDLLDQDNNSLAPLIDGELVEEIPDAESIMPANTIPTLKEAVKFNDKYYFLPGHPNVQITYYNQAKLDEYGVQPPKTWDELSAAGKTIMEKAGVGQLSIQGVAGGPVGVTVSQFLWQAGGDPLEINNEAGQQAFQFMQDLKQYLTPQYPTATFDTTNTYMLNDSVVIAQNWPFGVNVIVKDGGKKDVMAYEGWSGPKENALVLGGTFFGVAKGTDKKDMALDFTKVFMSRDVQEGLLVQNGWPAMRDDANGTVEDWQKPYFEVVNKALAVAKPRPSVAYWAKVEDVLTSAFNDIVTGGAPVKETLDNYQGQIDGLKG